MTEENLLNLLNSTRDKELIPAIDTLKASYKKCRKIGTKEKYTFEESESFDSLTSKFARASDIYTQKLLKTIFKLLQEHPVTFLDRINLAEKTGVIPSAEDMKGIRRLRNEIAHEYWGEQINVNYRQTLEIIPHLLKAVDTTLVYIRDKFRV